METQYICAQLIIILVFCIIIGCLFGLINKLNKHPNIENYSNEIFDKQKLGENNDDWNQLRNGQRSIDCYNLPLNKCTKYSNCGICLNKDGTSECVPGDNEGPLFKDDCDKWIHTDYDARHGLAETITNMVDPWSKYYAHDYEASYPSPISRSALQ